MGIYKTTPFAHIQSPSNQSLHIPKQTCHTQQQPAGHRNQQRRSAPLSSQSLNIPKQESHSCLERRSTSRNHPGVAQPVTNKTSAVPSGSLDFSQWLWLEPLAGGLG